jgi:hypothetical protein
MLFFAENINMEISGYTLSELSTILGIPSNTIKQRLFIAGIKPLTREAIYPASALEAIKDIKIGRPPKQNDKNSVADGCSTTP